jgi:hypothetical protein
MQLTENGLAEFKSLPAKSTDPKTASKKSRNAISTGYMIY